MDLTELHFAYPLWLWLGSFIPLIWILFFLFYQKNQVSHHLEKYIDSHLLPYLIINNPHKKSSPYKILMVWSLVWICLTVALAGPRWKFREIDSLSSDQSLVILLDLSESMNATDLKPSRLVRAKQKIEDLINLSKGVKIGLIAFAADPHMITPLTEDKETLRHLLPSLGTDLVYVQGSRLSSALEMGASLLEAEPGSNKSILVVSDGGFEDSSAISIAKKLAEKNIVIHALGVGTIEGAPLVNHQGNIIKAKGSPILSKLEKERLSEISHVGNGRYLESNYADQAESVILNELEVRATAQIALGKKNRIWDEHFYLLILPTLPVLLWWFRRGYLFAVLFIFLTPTFSINAQDCFKNSEELGKEALEAGDYETANQTFQDPYRKGVAAYKAGHYEEAERMFRLSSRPEVAPQAAYNLGNALVQQQKLKEAISAYEQVIEKWPDHTKAKENLELVKKMLEQQQQQNSDSNHSDEKNDPDQNESKDENKSKNSEKNNQDSKDDDNDSQNSKSNQTENKEAQDPKDSSAENSDQQENQAKNQSEDPKESLQDNETPEKGEEQETENSQAASQESKEVHSQGDQDADFWLNRLNSDTKQFLKNKFIIESKKNRTSQGVDPW